MESELTVQVQISIGKSLCNQINKQLHYDPIICTKSIDLLSVICYFMQHTGSDYFCNIVSVLITTSNVCDNLSI